MDNLSNFIYEDKHIFLKVIRKISKILNSHSSKNPKKAPTNDPRGKIPLVPQIGGYYIGAGLTKSKCKKSTYFINYPF
jgi:hypothetical protein